MKYKSRRASKTDPNDDLDLKAAFQAGYRDAKDYIDTVVSPSREKAMQYYNMEPLGTEEDGLSRAQMSVVRDMTNKMLPSLLRVFLNTENVVEFIPNGPEDVAGAEQATDYIRHIINTDNNGYTILHGVLHDALLVKSGIVKWYWDESVVCTEHEFSGLTPEEVMLLRSDPEIEVISQSIIAQGKVIPPDNLASMFASLPLQVSEMYGVAPPAGMPEANVAPTPTVTLDVTIDMRVKRTKRKGRVKIDGVPSEEFLITRNARSVGTADFVGHRRMITISDLVAMGYDKDVVETGSSDEDLATQREVLARNQGNISFGFNESSPSLRRVLYVEGYLRYDGDGDGIAELHKICSLGDDTILSDKVVDEAPFAIACPFPRPHMVIGDSLADLLIDLQEIETHLLRGMLDSLSLSINPRQVVVERDVNLDDVLASAEVGATIRVRNQGAVSWQSVPFTGQQVLPVLDFFGQLRASRTGITKASQGLDADALQSTTKAAVTATVEAALESIEMVARNIAETFFVRLASGLLKLIVRHQDRPRTIKMRNQWIEMDPRYWDTSMDVSVNVALGRGDDSAKIASLSQIAQMQERLMGQLGLDNPFITPVEFRKTWAKLTSLMGHKDTDAFIRPVTEESMAEWTKMQSSQPPPSDQLLAQAEIAKAQAAAQKINVDAQVALARIELDREKMRLDADMARDRLDAEIAIKAAELRLKGATVDVAAVNAMINRERNLLAQQRGMPAEVPMQEPMMDPSMMDPSMMDDEPLMEGMPMDDQMDEQMMDPSMMDPAMMDPAMIDPSMIDPAVMEQMAMMDPAMLPPTGPV